MLFRSVHTAVLCGSLYYAPQIAEWYNNHHHDQGETTHGEPATRNDETARAPETEIVERREDLVEDEEDLPLDDRLVLQPDDDDAEPPPLAPTPPHAQNLAEPPLPQAIDNDRFQNDAFGAPQAGPANAPQGPRPTPANRTVGAKKAKSLARKDQRRAYHEFHRQEAELRRLQEAEGKEEREALAAAERERRARVAEEIQRKEREEREARKREAEKDAEEEQERRERVVERVREAIGTMGAVDLVDQAWKEGKDRLWVERLIRASGLLGQLQKDDQRVMTTGDGWLVRIDADIMARAYAEAEEYGNAHGGRLSFDDLGGFIKTAVLAQSAAC